ncbi:WD40-repeat-containing domain protein [Crepidotus variabilis]|uniref:Ribosome biogenesis protein YTM1 n=1 Tax=Crepidotus variabilis TaxID=179855 RepID=A0A9P6EK57_9AGAR|nr:WD40-repeat-containing domain protein [Crepidotus variabilis]
MDSNSTAQPVIFFTETQYPLPSQKFLIPTAWRRYQLSQLVNKALSLEKPVPFDFLVKGEILRGTLSEWCAENGVGEEETLEIEYIESVMPPQKISDLPHEDWVSSVSCQLQGYLVTASYDGQIRMFDYSKNLVTSTQVHSAPLSSVCLISSDETTYTFASSSQDMTAHVTQVVLTSDVTPSSKVLASLHLHTASLSSVSSSINGSNLLTSSWDGLIGLWDTTIPSTDEVPEPLLNERDRKKRRRIEETDKPKRKAPRNVLKSHTARVSKSIFSPSNQTKALSCGFDSTVRIWDTEYGVCEHTFTASERPFLDLAVTKDGTTALATSTDRTMTMYDLRTSSNSLTASSAHFLHPSTPSCVAIGETNSHQVVTGAYDGLVRVWDLRSTKGPVATFKAWDGVKKVLSVDWKRGLVGVGGEGGVEVWRVGEEKS